MRRLRFTALLLAASCATACATLTKEEIAQRANLGDRDKVVKWLGDKRSWVREEAARALGHMRDVQSRDLLEARVSDHQERAWVRAAAAEALGVIGDAASLPLLSGLAVQPDTPPEVKIALVRAMCGFAGDEPLAAIAPLAGNEDLLVSAIASAELASSCGRAQ